MAENAEIGMFTLAYIQEGLSGKNRIDTEGQAVGPEIQRCRLTEIDGTRECRTDTEGIQSRETGRLDRRYNRERTTDTERTKEPGWG